MPCTKVICKLAVDMPGFGLSEGTDELMKPGAQATFLRKVLDHFGIEKVFGWIKQWGGLRQFKVRGTEKVSAVFGLHVIAYNLIRLGNLLNPAMAAA